MWCERQLTSFSPSCFLYQMQKSCEVLMANVVTIFFFYKVATAHFVLCISSSLLKTTKNVGVKHYIQWFHCCSNFVVYFYLKSFSFLVERSLLLLPRSMVCDMNIYMKNCLLLSSILINFWAFLLWILPVLRAFLSSWNFSAHCKFLISFSPQTLPTPYRNYFR